MALFVTAVHTFVAEHADELEFQAGDKIEVLERDEAFGDGWWKGRNTKGDEGLFPATYISEDPNAVPAGMGKADGPPVNGGSGDDEPTPATAGNASETPPVQSNGDQPNNVAASGAGADGSADEDNRNSLVDVTGAPRGIVTAGTVGGAGAGNNVMDRTIGEVQEAIDRMGAPSPSRTPEAPAQKVYQLKDPQEAAREDEDDMSDGDGEGAIGINSDARARLAAQAKLANEEADRQHQRESGGVADLIYSDESDEEEEGSTGSRRASRGYRGLSLNGTHPSQTTPPTTTTIAERIEDEDRVEPPLSLAAATVPASVPPPTEDMTPAATSLPPSAQDSVPTPPQPQNAVWTPVPYPPVSQFKEQEQTTEQAPSNDTADASHTPSVGALAAGGAGAAALAGVGAAVFASGPSPKDTTSALPHTSPNLVSDAMPEQPLPAPGRRTSSLPHNTPPMGSSNLPVTSPGTQPAPLPAGAAPPATITPRMDQAAQLQPALPITSPAAPGVVAAATPSASSPAASSPGLMSPGTAARMPAKPPMTWTVEEVVEWARSRGFDEGVCNKFVEQDITGDVLLELDANLLKELDIPQLGKRLRIAAAINELRRPPSAVSNKSSHLTPHQTSQTTSPVPPAVAAMPDTQSLTQTPQTHSQTPSQSSSIRGLGMVTPAFVGQAAAQSTPPLGSTSPVVDEHHNAWSHGRKVSVTPTTQSIDESKAVEGPIVTNGHNHAHSQSTSISQPASSTVMASHSSSRSTSSIPSTVTATAGTGAKESLVKRESTSSLTGHKKNKGSVDKSDRLSFFGRGRKAPPPASSGNGSPVGPERNASARMPFTAGHKPAMQTMTADKPDGTSTTPSAGVGAALRQIGKPDKVGYLKKRGERYNTWKTRYFVLKGSHLYYLKSENEDRVKGHIDLKGHKIIVDENTNPGNYGFRLVGPSNDNKPHFFSSSDQIQVRDWMKSLMKATIARDYSVPVTSSCNIPTIPLAEAQALQPRPPSPAQREATQRATRRENVNQLTPRDASVLMSLDTTGSGKRMTSHGSAALQPSPSRPDRDMRRPSTGKETIMSRPSMAISDRRSVTSYYGQPETEEQAELLKWVNETLPPQYPRAAHFPSSFMSGEVILLLVKHLSGIEPNPPVPSSAFAPDATGLPNVEGLLAMGETVIDAGVDSAGAITHLLETVRSWARQKGYA